MLRTNNNYTAEKNNISKEINQFNMVMWERGLEYVNYRLEACRRGRDKDSNEIM